MPFKISQQFVEDIKKYIESQDNERLQKLLAELHPADIAELFEELTFDEVLYVFMLLDQETGADVLAEIDDYHRKLLLKSLPDEVLARRYIEFMDTDDAADVLADLDENRQETVLRKIEDVEHAGDIADLLDYPEDTAGGLMQKEFVAVNENWTVQKCIDEIRKQAEEVEEVYYVYVVDDNNRFKGVLSLKKLILSKPDSKISNLYKKDAIAVKAKTPAEEVANIMDKYDLVAMPVIDEVGRLIGRITFDDVIDFIREEAEKDYQMATGLSADVEIKDNVWRLTKARIPWLLFGLFGEMINANVISNFEEDLSRFAATAFFMPLIAATGGNVGIQSSAIIVQSIAAGDLGNESSLKKILKEFSVAIINATILSLIIYIYNHFVFKNDILTYSVSIALFSVVIFASMFGIIVPLVLNKFKIDPAIATGPFITIVNDISGMGIYLLISRWLYNVLT